MKTTLLHTEVSRFAHIRALLASRGADAGRLMWRSRAVRTAAKAAGGTCMGLTVAAGAQGLYLMSLYKPLPEASGPMSGIVRVALARPHPSVEDAASCPDANEHSAGLVVAAVQATSPRLQRCTSGGATAVGAVPQPPHAPHAQAPLQAQAQAPLQAPMKAPLQAQAQAPLQALAQAPLQSQAQAPLPPPPPRGERSLLNLLFVGDSLVTGVGCCPEGARGPALPRSVAEEVSHLLGRDVQWTALGHTGGNVREIVTSQAQLLATYLLPATTS